MEKEVVIEGITYKYEYPFAYVKSCDKTVTTANVKAKIEDCVVTTILPNAFDGCSNLTTVYIESAPEDDIARFDSVVHLDFYIGSYAFSECNNLTEITIPHYFNLFERGAFRKCTKLKTINYFASVVLGDFCFSYCSSLSKIPFNYINLPESCFSYCESLTEFSVREGVREIETDAFEHCDNLEYVFIPKSVKIIGQTVFRNDFKLKKIEFEEPENWIYESAYFDEKKTISFLDPEKNAKDFMWEDFDDGVECYKKQ